MHGLDLEEQDRRRQQQLREKHGIDSRGRMKADKAKPKAAPAQKISKKDLQDSLKAGIPMKKPGRKRKNQEADGNDGAPATKKAKRAKNSNTSNPRNGNCPYNGTDQPQPLKPKRGSKKARRAPEGQIEDLNSLIVTGGSRFMNPEHSRISEHQFSARNKRDALAELIRAITDESMQDAAKADTKALNEATKKLDQPSRVKPQGNGWQLQGMNTPLRNFQLLGLSVMREFERRTTLSRGGILADAMGLGKTITMIANMVNGRAPTNESVQSTLVIVPTAVIMQWMSEIKKHLEPDCLPAVVIYNREYADGSRDVVRSLQRHDIVLTTFEQLRRSWPKYKPPHDYDDDEKQKWWEEVYDKQRGPLHRIMWLRVVIDECQAIKNHESHIFKAASGLMARHRWLMSGTPMVNDITELYAYSIFLKAPLTNKSFYTFQKDFVQDEKAKDRMSQYLKGIMIRRTYDSKICGSPIVMLPDSQQVTFQNRFSCFEARVYEIVRDRCQDIFRGWMEDKTSPEGRLLWRGLLLLSILRQLTGHSLSCIPILGKYLELKDVDNLRNAVNHIPDATPEVVEKVKKEFTELRRLIVLRKKPAEKSSEKKPTPEGHCVTCRDGPEDLWITTCNHILCSKCMDRAEQEALHEAQDAAICPSIDCGAALQVASPKEVESSTTESDLPNDGTKKKKEVRNFDLDVILLSTKMREVRRLIRSWLMEDPKMKIVVFTQFLQIAWIVHTICESEGWGHNIYSGKMTSKLRQASVDGFQKNSSKQILIASMMAGGVGLNLTKATRAILIDLYWNEAMEQQGEFLNYILEWELTRVAAFSRIYRIGQEKPTLFHRFSLLRTCDQYLIRKQMKKTRDITHVLEGKGKSFTVEELLELFSVSPMVKNGGADEVNADEADRDEYELGGEDGESPYPFGDTGEGDDPSEAANEAANEAGS